MYMLKTIGYSADDMADDVALAKRFVVQCWSPTLQQYQPQIVSVEEKWIAWEIEVPRALLSDEAIAWCVDSASSYDTMAITDETVSVSFVLPNKPDTIVTIKNYKEH